jgi:two-component system chemotaxis sensor kinase CheA
VRAFAGATIMGDGRIALILDALGLAEMAGVNSFHRDNFTGVEDGSSADQRTVLLFSLGGRRLALLLEMVARLEVFEAASVEEAGDRRVVQYRNEILPLVFLAEELGYPTHRTLDSALRVVVYTEGDRSVGLVVDEIHDIVEQAIDITEQTAVPGTLGSAVIQGLVTDVLDVEGVLRRALDLRLVGAAS